MALNIRQCEEALRASKALTANSKSAHMRRKHLALEEHWQRQLEEAKQQGRY